MKTRKLSLAILAFALVCLIDAIATENLNAKTDVNNEEKGGENKTSTFLAQNDGNNKTENTREIVSSALRPSKKREQIVEVVPIIRSVSPPQKLTMRSSTSTRNTSNTTTSLATGELGSIVGGSNRENASRELMLPIGVDITKILSDDVVEDEERPEELPEAQELKFVRINGRKRPVYRPPPRRPTTLNRRNVYSEISRPPPTLIRPPRRPTETKRNPTEKECTFFTKTVCLEATDYPHEAIMRSLRGNKEMVAALLTDYKTQDYGNLDENLPVPLPLENKFENRYTNRYENKYENKYENRFENKYENRYENNEIKRSDNPSPYENIEEGFTCPSTVKYARPQLARAASGIWKYIINTGEHTQTLRLEKCSNAQSSCSFISENYRSSCVQVYNYHRLLTWDSKLGLHMDIFKVPTCCSCHVHGYSEIFPPHHKDPPPKPQEKFPGADFATDQKDDFQDLVRPNYLTSFGVSSNFDSTLVPSNKKPVEITPSRPTFTLPVRTRTKKPSTVPRPFDKLPQQHAPNTRAPGYTGPLSKGTRPRHTRPPFRRESSTHFDDNSEISINSTIGTRFSQPYDQEMDASTKLQNGGFDDEYQEPHRQINYNYHPIIDFFKPEASMLQSTEPQLATQPALVQSDTNSWKPVISS